MAKYKRYGTSSRDILERLLNHTTLTTQRVGHTHILDIGGKLLDCKSEDVKEDHGREIEEAVMKAEERATRELRAALKRLRRQLEEDKRIALESQKQYHQRHIERVLQSRNTADEERIREVTKNCEKDKQDALEKLRVKLLEERDTAYMQSLEDMRREVMEGMKEVVRKGREEAARIAREQAEKEAADAIDRTRNECLRAKETEIARLQKLHNVTLAKLQQCYDGLNRKYKQEVDVRMKVETDYELLQEDYKRFLDFTDGKFHSDYLMRRRNYGRGIVGKYANEYEDQSLMPEIDVSKKQLSLLETLSRNLSTLS